MNAPDLPHGCGSWMITIKATGKCAFETFERRTADQFASMPGIEVLTALDYLVNLNKKIRNQA